MHTGFVSNGEYNVFREKGYTRPLSVLKLRSLARSKVARMSISKMEAMLCPVYSGELYMHVCWLMHYMCNIMPHVHYARWRYRGKVSKSMCFM